MPCMTKRDHRHLSATLWRTKTIILRNKGKALGQLSQSLNYMIILLIATIFVGPAHLDINSSQEVTATVSNIPTLEHDYFVDAKVSTPFTLPHCSVTGFNASYIGVVYNNNVDEDIKEYEETMSLIYSDLKSAFDTNNDLTTEYNQMKRVNFKSLSDLQTYMEKKSYSDEQLCFSYGFSEFEPQTHTFDFNLYFTAGQIPSTHGDQVQYAVSTYAVSPNGESAFTQLNTTGFEQLMTTATSAVLKTVYQLDTINFQVAYLPMDTGSFFLVQSQVVTLILYPLIILCSAMIALQIVKTTVYEDNEGKIEWFLNLAGHSKVTGIFFELICTCMVTLPYELLLGLICNLVCFPNLGIGANLINVFLFVCNMTTILLIISAFCNHVMTKVVSLAIAITMLALQLLQALKPTVSAFDVYVLSWLPNMTVLNLVRLSMNAENLNQKITLSTLSEPVQGIYPAVLFIVPTLELIFLIGFLIYLWPIQINPDPEEPRHIWYPFTPSFWIHCCTTQPDPESSSDEEYDASDDASSGDSDEDEEKPKLDKETVKKMLTVQEYEMMKKGSLMRIDTGDPDETLQLRKLTKKYGDKLAVDNLNLTLLDNQIMVLLGHSGAGKSTTINMITSAVKATKGKVNYKGKNILKDTLNVADDIGLCPQENILIRKLTVAENLEFLGRFKGVGEDATEDSDSDEKTLDKQIVDLLAQCEMTAKRDMYPPSLAQSDKRKLQLMMALLGKPTILLLDEPTRGMVHNSRKEAWEIIMQCREDAIIFTTTMEMDEASALGDRISFLANGKLVCCGSPEWLRATYCEGFYIDVTRAADSTQAQLEAAQECLQKWVDQAHETLELEEKKPIKKVEHPKLHIFNVPDATGVHFQEMFEEWDNRVEEFGIKDYFVRSVTLDQVYAHVGLTKKDEIDEDDDDKDSKSGSVARSERAESIFLMSNYLGERHCWKTFNTLMKFQLKTAWFYICAGFCCIPILILIAMGIVVGSTHVNATEISLTNYSSIYQSVLPLQIPANQQTIIDARSTDPLLASMVATNLSYIDWQTTDIIPTDVEYSLGAYSSALSNMDETYYGAYLVYQMPEAPTSKDLLSVAIYGNLSSLTSQGTFGALMLQQIARYYTSNDDFTMSFTNEPLKPNIDVTVELSVKTLSFFFTMTYVWSLLLCGIVVNQLAQRFENRFYDQIMMKSGAPFTYFFTKYILDVLMHLFALVCVIWLPAAFGLHFEGLWVSGILWVISDPLFMHCWTYHLVREKRFKRKHFFGSYLSILTTCLVFINTALGYYSTTRIAHLTVLCTSLPLIWIPTFNLMMSIIAVTQVEQISVLHHDSWNSHGPLSRYGSQLYIFALILCCIVYGIWILALLLDHCTKKPATATAAPFMPEKEDKFVTAEREKVQEKIKAMSQRRGAVLKAANLVKAYEDVDSSSSSGSSSSSSSDSDDELPPQTADDKKLAEVEKTNNAKIGGMVVKGVSFNVHRGEALALIGPSGCGKTLTLNMMAGEEPISGGQVFMDDLSIETIHRKAHYLDMLLGYCRQKDSMDKDMNVKGTLRFFCNLVGVKDSKENRVIGEYLKKFLLKDCADKNVEDLDKDERRKLNLAVAMIGQPKVLLLDACTADVKDEEKPMLWKAIREESLESAVVLATQEMEEAKQCGTRCAIMTAGRLKAIGPVQSVREQYGGGYQINFNFDFKQIEKIQDQIALDENQIAIKKKKKIRKLLNEWQDTLSEDRTVRLNFGLEYSASGVLSHYYQTMKDEKPVPMHIMQGEVIVKNEISAIMDTLCEQISDVEMIKYDGSYVYLRTEPHKQTCGYVHGVMEEIKKKHPIFEYQVMKTNLETIVSSFAAQELYRSINDRLLNPPQEESDSSEDSSSSESSASSSKKSKASSKKSSKNDDKKSEEDDNDGNDGDDGNDENDEDDDNDDNDDKDEKDEKDESDDKDDKDDSDDKADKDDKDDKDDNDDNDDKDDQNVRGSSRSGSAQQAIESASESGSSAKANEIPSAKDQLVQDVKEAVEKVDDNSQEGSSSPEADGSQVDDALEEEQKDSDGEKSEEVSNKEDDSKSENQSKEESSEDDEEKGGYKPGLQ